MSIAHSIAVFFILGRHFILPVTLLECSIQLKGGWEDVLYSVGSNMFTFVSVV